MDTLTNKPAPLETEYELTQDQIDYYRQNGHILLRNVCPAGEVEKWAEIFREVVADKSRDLKPLEERDEYGKAFVQIMNLWREDDRCKEFVYSRRFAQIAARLMGCSGARLYHDQALYKEPGGKKTAWHQDQTYWPLDTDTTVTMWMPLVDITESMGTMYFGSGSHKEGYLGDSHIEEASDEKWEKLLADKGIAIHNHGAMKAGDATFHAGLVLHGAPGNDSDRMREVMTVIYFPDGAIIMNPDNDFRQADLESWIPGGVPGTPAASDFNPLLYNEA